MKGSDEFVRFLNVLGDTIDLKGWTGYRGGLDVKGRLMFFVLFYNCEMNCEGVSVNFLIPN